MALGGKGCSSKSSYQPLILEALFVTELLEPDLLAMISALDIMTAQEEQCDGSCVTWIVGGSGLRILAGLYALGI